MKYFNPPLVLAILCGCAAPIYKPFESGVGYSEANVAKNRYEVMFHGTRDQDEMSAKNYALIRAAEIGKQNSFAYFRIANAHENEQQSKETIRESETQNYASGANGKKKDPYRNDWGQRTEVKTVTRVENKPVVKIVVQYQNDDCGDCLSVDQKLREAAGQGILKN